MCMCRDMCMCIDKCVCIDKCMYAYRYILGRFESSSYLASNRFIEFLNKYYGCSCLCTYVCTHVHMCYVNVYLLHMCAYVTCETVNMVFWICVCMDIYIYECLNIWSIVCSCVSAWTHMYMPVCCICECVQMQTNFEWGPDSECMCICVMCRCYVYACLCVFRCGYVYMHIEFLCTCKWTYVHVCLCKYVYAHACVLYIYLSVHK